MQKLQKNKTKFLLRNALTELLQEKPFEEIRLNEICDKAMVHKTTFYNHFEDKYELLNYIIKEIQKDMLNDISDNNGILQYYLDVAKKYIKHIKENCNFYKSILNTNNNGICFNMTYNIFVEDVKKRIQSYTTDVPASYVSIFYVSAVFSVIGSWVNTGMKETEEEMISYIEKLITQNKSI